METVFLQETSLLTRSYQLKLDPLSVCPSVLLFRRFLGIAALVFSKFWHGLETHMKLCVTEPDIPEKKFF